MEIGKKPLIRSGSIIYPNVKIGDFFKSGHRIMIREDTVIGDHVLIGTNTVIENKVKIGNHVSIQSCVYIPTNTTIGNYVFIGPCVCFTNDKYPIRIVLESYPGPIIEDGVSLGAGSVILPGIRIGKGSLVAAGSVVTRNVPPWSLAKGSPARFNPLKKELRKLNEIK